jgi:hypothetical protein
MVFSLVAGSVIVAIATAAAPVVDLCPVRHLSGSNIPHTTLVVGNIRRETLSWSPPPPLALRERQRVLPCIAMMEGSETPCLDSSTVTKDKLPSAQKRRSTPHTLITVHPSCSSGGFYSLCWMQTRISVLWGLGVPCRGPRVDWTTARPVHRCMGVCSMLRRFSVL